MTGYVAGRFVVGAVAYVIVFSGLLLLCDPAALAAGGQWLIDVPWLVWATLP